MTFRQAAPLIILAVLFVVCAYVAQVYRESFISLLGDEGQYGLFIYILITISATVIPPISSLPLVPIAASLWGPFTTALASIIGWFLGALIAFSLSRRYGRPLAERMVSPERLCAIEARFSGSSLFWSIAFLQMVVPVDVLSYALGLFKSVSRKTYVTATFIGIIPFAFVFAYVGALHWTYQLPIIALVLLYVVLANRSMLRPPPSQGTGGSG
jgi:uncharacterized membrane protein YdjX (TVP38/TMEM64 family)